MKEPDDQVHHDFIYDSSGPHGFRYDSSGGIAPVEMTLQRTNMTYDGCPVADEPIIVEKKPETGK
jgi:hypothetical protein